MIPGAFPDDIIQRVDLLGAALVAAMPGREVLLHQLAPHTDFHDAQLQAGVVQVSADRETDYSDFPGMEAREGTLRVIVLVHLKVAEGAARRDLGEAEAAVAAQIKAWVRAGVPGVGLSGLSVQFSRGLSFPFGFVVAYLSAAPQQTNVL